MAENTVRGRFVWHELVTPNAQGAHEFYSKALGWTTQAFEHDPSYQMFAASSGPLGGTVEQRDGVPHWRPYVGTDDVDSTVEAAKRLGAKVVIEPTALPNGGRFAVLSDPNGATFGVHAAAREPAPEAEPKAGEFSWHELATTVDPVAAFGFYEELFGWEDLDHHDMGPDGIYLLFGRNGAQLGGIFNKGSAGKPGSAYWLGYVRASDVDRMAEDVKAARGVVLVPPMDVPGGHRIAQFEDPHGAFFAGHTLAQDKPAARAGDSSSAARADAEAAKERKTAASKKTASTKSASTKSASKKAAKKKAARPAKKRARKGAGKTAKKAAKKRGAKAAKKPAKRGAKKAAKKAARKPASRGAAKKAKPKARRKRR